jgi:hypothetical protein
MMDEYLHLKEEAEFILIVVSSILVGIWISMYRRFNRD